MFLLGITYLGLTWMFSFIGLRCENFCSDLCPQSYYAPNASLSGKFDKIGKVTFH